PLDVSGPPLPPVNPSCPSPHTAVNSVTFHRDRGRTGWNEAETDLTPAEVSGPSFGWLWDSEPLDTLDVDGVATYPPRIYGSPLYVDDLQITGGDHAGIMASAVLVATSNAWVYAVNACATGESPDVPAGAILWRARLGTASVVPALDGGVPLG